MVTLKRAWQALPLLLRASVVALLIVQIGSTLAVIPLVANLKFHPEIPWVLPATLVVVGAYQLWLSGWGFPASTRDLRRRSARVGRVSWAMWRGAIPAIVVGVGMLVLMRLATPFVLPVAAPAVKINLSAYPLVSVIGGLASIAISAAVVEETGFRGYMQQPLEMRYGVVPAMLATGVVFWIAHLPDVTITHLPGQVLASVVFGLLAWFTRSLWPAIIAHAFADLLLQPAYLFHAPGFVWTALTARPIWQGQALSLAQKAAMIGRAFSPSLLLAPGPGRLFAVLAWSFAATAALTGLAFVNLARLSRREAARR